LSDPLTPTRKEFLHAVGSLIMLPAAANAAFPPPKVLIVVAHPDDEYAFTATVYRITRELGGIADQVVITNGEGGYRYAALAQSIYGVSLTEESVGRAHLPAIRRAETLRAGQILGVRRHYFLDQKDSGFADDAAAASSGNWDRRRVLSALSRLLGREHYNFVFTLLPTAETHGHHRAAALLLLEAVSRLPETERPAVLGAEAGNKHEVPLRFAGLDAYPATRPVESTPTIVFDRETAFGYHNALSYQIVVNWVIAEHKSQGLFQSDYGRHNLEQFWLFAVSGTGALSRTHQLAEKLCLSARQSAAC
jgi:N-acetylglucosamine malate deacetylase 2